MTEMRSADAGRFIALRAQTAAELMTPGPLSLRDNATLREAVAFLIDRGISGAPVIDEAGRPVGVLTQTDILIHGRQKVDYLEPAEYESGAPLPHSVWKEFQIEKVDTKVRMAMTPAVFSVALHAPAATVIEEMCALNVHRLFVIDGHGVLVGVISALDVLRHLELSGPEERASARRSREPGGTSRVPARRRPRAPASSGKGGDKDNPGREGEAPRCTPPTT
jgi:CBS domain-containing protein